MFGHSLRKAQTGESGRCLSGVQGLVRPVKQEAGGEAVTEPLQWSRYEGMEVLSGRCILVDPQAQL